MKFATLFTTSTILLWQQNVSAQEEHHNVRLGTTVSSGNVVRMTKSVAATAIKCEDVDLEDLNFADWGSNLTCEKNSIVGLVKEKMSEASCRTTNKDVKETVKALGSNSSYNQAKTNLLLKCREQSNNYESCTSIEELNFSSISSCKTGDVLNRLKDVLDGKECAHDWKYDAQLLTDKPKFNQARSELSKICKTIKGCTTDFTVNGCDYIAVKKELTKITDKSCSHDADQELQIITGANSLEEAKKILASKCSTALGGIEQSTFTDIDGGFTDAFMKEYIAGKGFLNERTGNFQGDVEDSDQESIDAGKSIDAFRDDGAVKSKLVDGNWGDNTFSSCENQAYLCCFGRDRQFGDNNGNCAKDDCDDADPGDNSNLCYSEPDLTAYPGEIEDDIHCHGLAWADDSTDLISTFKVNNFFFVSLYDHMYSRGYVESTVPVDPNNVPMCGCIEHMPKVSRADCTQVDVDLPVSFSRDTDGVLTLKFEEDAEVNFNSCKGIKVGTKNQAANNDLASYANRLNIEGRMDDQFMYSIFDTLLGYESPGNNENEAVCKAGYENVATEKDSDHPCVNFDSNDTFDGCDVDTVVEFIEDEMNNSCGHGLKKELQILTGTSTHAEATDYISQMCVSAWENVWASYEDTKFTDIHEDFDDAFMKDYIKGETYLNERTGNFQGNTKKSDSESVEAGEAIDEFHEADENGAKSSILSATFQSEQTNFEDCELNSIMCCFGRDRQFGDNNGDCARNDCEDADPADNSNLCYTEPSFIPFPKAKEGDIHCHGLAWADDPSDPSNKLKYNNFFYVSLYDHMYTRGYVQTMTYDQDTGTDVVPMCGCIEDMWPVSRSDCTEIGYDLEFKLIIGENGTIEASPVDLDETEIEFNACKGINPGNPNKKKNNDLSSYVYRLVDEGKMSEEKKDSIYEVLVGYQNPNANANEKACKASYEAEDGTGTYPKK